MWTQPFVLGDSGDDFTLSIPDIRMPPNQIWPLHWHDCCIAVIVIRIDGRELKKGAIIIARSDSEILAIEGVHAGAQLLDLARPACGMGPIAH